jgi:predicted transcriptional regulator
MEVNYNRTDSFEFRACGPVDTPLGDSLKYYESEVFDQELTTREINILLLLAIEAYSKNSQAELSFQGIKTKLNLHQQKVTKALKRLQDKQLILKTLNGYSLTRNGIKLVNRILLSPQTSLDGPSREYIGLEIKVPLNNKNNDLFKLVYLLKGRWFGNWRWIGMFQSPTSIKMEWQSLSGELEACLCLNEVRMCIAIFDKDSIPSSPNLELLTEEFQVFLAKIQTIMDKDLGAYQDVSHAIIRTHSSCNKLKMSNWLSNYA